MKMAHISSEKSLSSSSSASQEMPFAPTGQEGEYVVFKDRHTSLYFQMIANNPTVDDMIARGIYEFPLIQWCREFLGVESTFIDIGAHIGTYSVYLSQYSKRVIAFECQNRQYECLTANIKNNGLVNVETHHLAVGSMVGETVLHCNSVDGGSSSVLGDVIQKFGTPLLSQETVKMTTLDATLVDLTRIDLIKIDVEGAELHVLLGAISTLERCGYPPILFEAWPHEWYKYRREATIGFLTGLGYKVIPLSGSDNMYLASDHPLRPVKPKTTETSSSSLEAVCPKEGTWDQLHECSKSFRLQGKNQEAFNHAKLGLACLPVDQTDQAWKLYEEIGIVAYYIDQKDEGHAACNNVVLSNAPGHTRNQALRNMSFYMKPLSCLSRKTFSTPPGQFGTYHASSPSIFRDKTGKLLFNLRLVNYQIGTQGQYFIDDHLGHVRTENQIIELYDDFSLDLIAQPTFLIPSNLLCPLYPGSIRGLEDLRLFGEDATGLRFFATCLETNRQHVPQICLGTLVRNVASVSDNGSDLKGEDLHITYTVTDLKPLRIDSSVPFQCEKNWMPWIDNGTVKFIYSWEPLRIFEIQDGKMDPVEIYNGRIGDRNLDTFRGSAPPIKYKGGMLCTVHQVFYNSPRQYYHRFVWISDDFTQVQYSDPYFFEERQIEFNLSICHHKDGLLVGYSVMDNTATLAVVDYNVLDTMLWG
jgi:FkbM family methyltransferase